MMNFIFKFKSNNGVYTLFDGAYSFIIATSKDTVIDCAKLTDQDLITLAQHVFIGEIITLKLIDFYAYVQLRLLGNLESPSNLQLQDEASIISNISKINFAGDAVVATLDPSDTSGKTGLITITSGGGGQTFHGIAFPDLPIPEFSTEIGNDAYKYVVDDIDFMISDVDITIPENNSGGELPDISDPIEIIFAQRQYMPDSFTVRVSIKAFGGFTAGVHFYDGSFFIEGTDDSSFPGNTKTTWIFQMRGGSLKLVSVTTAGDSPSLDTYGYLLTNPFVRYDSIQPIAPTYQDNARTTIDAASNAYVAQVEAESMSRYPAVVRNNVLDTITTNGMYRNRGTAILQMDRAAPNTVTVSPIDFDDVGGLILYLTIVRAGNGVTTVDINSIGSPFHGAPPGGTYTLATKGDAITLMATRFWTGAEFIQYWQCIGRYQQAGSGGGGSSSLIVKTETGTSYTLITADTTSDTYLRMTSTDPNEVTIPIEQTIPITIRQAGVGQTTLIEGAGVALVGNVVFASQNDTKTVIPIGSGFFDVIG